MPTRPTSWADVALISCALMHAILACVTFYWVYSADYSQQHFTHRVHFADWNTLLDVYRTTASYSDPGAGLLKAVALDAAWCNYTLPPATAYPELCDCISARHAEYVVATAPVAAAIPQALREAGAQSLLQECMRARPTWRVYPVWSFQTATPVYYVLMVSACFGMGAVRSSGLEWLAAFFAWGVAGFTLVVMCVVDVAVNGMWALAFVSAAVVIHIVLAPGLRRAPFSDYRCMSCFWFAEFFVAPAYVTLVPMYGSGRDLVLIVSMAILGGLLGSLGLRSFWYAVAFQTRPQFLTGMRWSAWLGIAVLSAFFCAMAALVYHPTQLNTMSGGSVALLAVTCLVGLLQLPGVSFDIVFPAQVGLCVARNITLTALVLYDFA